MKRAQLNNRMLALFVLLVGMIGIDNASAAEPTNWSHPRGDLHGRAFVESLIMDRYKPAWTYKTGGAVLSSAIAVDGVVYVGSEDKHLHAIDAKTGKRKWAFKAETLIDASPVYEGGVVYIGTDGGVMHAIDAATGTEKWKFKSGGRISGEAGVVQYTDDADQQQQVLLFGSHDGLLYCLNAKDGSKRWTYETGDYINCGITLDSDRNTIVLGGCDAVLHMIDLKTGKGVGEVEIDGEVAGTPAMDDSQVILGHMQGEVVAVNLKTKKVAWRFRDRDFPFIGSPALFADKLLIGSRGRRLYCLDPKTGEKQWDIRTHGGIDGSPIIGLNRAVFGTSGGRLSVIDTKNGDTFWQHDIGAPISVTPTPMLKMLVVGAEDGNVYAFKAVPQPDAD